MLPGITSESIDQVISQEPAEAVLSTLNDSDNEEEMHEEESLQNKHVPHQAHDAKGMAVHFTHQNWELVVNIMMGIRKAISNVMAEPNRPLCPDDYVMKEKMTLAAPKSSPAGASAEGGKLTPSSCRFVDYAPMVFRKLREIWGIPTEEYMLSVGPQQILRRREERVRGRQYHAGLADDALGAVFGGQVGLLLLLLGRREVYGEDHLPHGASFLPQDSRQVLLAHRHQPRFLGAHQIRFGRHSKFGSKRIYFVVMGNLFDTPFKIERRFDLKGSWAGRLFAFVILSTPARPTPSAATSPAR